MSYSDPKNSNWLERDINVERFLATCRLLELSTFTYNNREHLRCSKVDGSMRFDYFPSTGRGNWVGTKEYFIIENLENFLFINFRKISSYESNESR